VVWENVPGVLSIDGGRTFGAFLGGLGELGYGFAYRVLDAQYFGLAQRRQRVFVVGYLGDWRRAAAVLFERHSLSGHPAPSREAGEAITPTIRAGVANSGAGHGARSGDSKDELIVPVAGNIGARTSRSIGADDAANGHMHAVDQGYLIPACPPLSLCLNAGAMGRLDWESETLIPTGGCFDVAHTLKADGFDASEDGTGRGTPIVSIAFGWQNSSQQGASEHCTPTLDKSKTPAIAVALRGREGGATAELGDECAHALRASQGGGDKPHALTGMAVRRLTPQECERLQGFPDDYTLLPGKTADGPRYKALGNSMAVPVMRWIGERIQQVEDLLA
jgi:DNA (cytosine-5)-methyltransferase 1